MFSKLVTVLVLIEICRCHITSISKDFNNIEIAKVLPQNETSTNSYLSGLTYMHKLYRDCSTTDFSTCFKINLISVIDRIGRHIKDVPLLDDVILTKNSNKVEDPIQTTSQIEESLPRSLTEKEETLNKIIMDKLLNLFNSHTLQVSGFLKTGMLGICDILKRF